MATPLKTAISNALSKTVKSKPPPTLSEMLKPSIYTQPYSLRKLNAIVVSSGLMDKTVKVSIGIQEWNSHIRKKFSRKRYLLVHDPRTSLRTGDVITISPGWRASKNVHHIVDSIIAPFGPPASARPPVMTLSERLADREARQIAKVERKDRAWSAATKARKEAMRKEIMSGVDVDALVAREWEELMRVKPVVEEGLMHFLEAGHVPEEEREWKELRKRVVLKGLERKRLMKTTEAARRTKEMLDERRRKADRAAAVAAADKVDELEVGLEGLNLGSEGDMEQGEKMPKAEIGL